MFRIFKQNKFRRHPSDSQTERLAGDETQALAPSEGLLQKWLVAVALLGLPLVLFVFYYKLMFVGLENPFALDYAQLGRNLSEGRGFTTYYLRPLALVHGDNMFRQADVTHGPLFPMFLALAFGIRGANDATSASVSAAFFLFTVPIVYLLGLKVFSRTVALLAALIFAANPLMLQYAASGLPITLQVFLMTCLLFAVFYIAISIREKEKTPSSSFPKIPLIAVGVLTSSLYLTQSVFLCLVPVMMVTVLTLCRQQMGKVLIYFFLPLLLLMLPWMVRLGLLTGNPLFGLKGMQLWMGTDQFYPGTIGYRHTPIDLAPSVGLFNATLRKMLLTVTDIVNMFPQVSGSWILAFLLPSLLFRFRDSATMILRRVLMYCFAGIFIGMLPFGTDMTLFVCLIPTMLIFAIAYLLHLVDQSRLSRSSTILLISLFGATVVLPVLRSTVLAERPQPLVKRTAAMALKQRVKKDEIILTDQPWLVSWYADRPAVWIPAVDDKVPVYRTRFPKLRWLFLTEEVAGFSPQWMYIYNYFRNWNDAYMKLYPAYLRGEVSFDKVPGRPVVAGDQFPLASGLKGFAPIPGLPINIVTAELLP